MNAFARDVGILTGHPAYADIVATPFTALWKTDPAGPAPASNSLSPGETDR